MRINVNIGGGLHIVAVSGGVDSVVLLDLLSKQPGASLIVAHFDHGIRKSSKNDRLFVETLAKNYGFNFEYGEGELGPSTSEDEARRARYKFLNDVKQKYKAVDIVTAHHQDDLIETAIINLTRGTGRRGLSSLRSHQELQRPLLGVPKVDLIAYATEQGLKWHEDETNTDTMYLRNHIRHEIIPKLSDKQRTDLLKIINQTSDFNTDIDSSLATLIDTHLVNGNLDRQWFIMLPHEVAVEVMATWLRQSNLAAFDSRTLERLVVGAKTFRANTQVDIYNNYSLVVKKKYLALTSIDR